MEVATTLSPPSPRKRLLVFGEGGGLLCGQGWTGMCGKKDLNLHMAVV